MFFSFSRRRLAGIAPFILTAALPLASAAASLCLDTAAQTPPTARALAMAQAAEREHLAFGGQAMDAEGRMTTAGLSEAEDTRIGRLSAPPWQRVLGYWRAVDAPDARARLPSEVRFGALRPADRTLLEQALDEATADRLQGLGVGPDQGLQSHELRAAIAAIDRVAVIDTPWSAAFISWLARQARLGAGEFTFSDAHSDYAGAAWRAGAAEAAGHPSAYAMRACDIAATPPRIGDLVCQTREDAAAIDNYDRIGRVLADRPTGGSALPMHCDVVVAVDAGGFDAIGGNVLQSVTRRRFVFAPGTRQIDPSYLSQGCDAAQAGCVDRHMSRGSWSLLLQWR